MPHPHSRLETAGPERRPQRGTRIQPESALAPRQTSERLLWGIVLSLLVHVLLLVAAVTLLPSLAARFASPVPPAPAPQILKMRLRERTADVDPASAVKSPPPTPLTGQAASRAQDRTPGPQDTPFPAGLERGLENALARAAGAPAAADARREPPPTDADAVPPRPESDALRAVMQDAMRSEKSLLTGRREPANAGSPAGTTPQARTTESPEDTGALQFGDDFKFSTTAWNWQPYWEHMRTKLYANWNPPAAFKDYGIIPGGWTVVRVVLDRNGRIRTCKILGQKGHASLHPASFGAMQGAAPFRPLPVEFPDDSLVVTVRFMYLPQGDGPGDSRPVPPGATAQDGAHDRRPARPRPGIAP